MVVDDKVGPVHLVGWGGYQSTQVLGEGTSSPRPKIARVSILISLHYLCDCFSSFGD